jgi:hypothetical protein
MQAAEWWKQRTKLPMPNSVDEVIALSPQLRVPTAVKVSNLNRRFSTIVEYIFSTIN